MLVLSRKPGERVLIPDCDLTFTVVAVEGKNVRVGISAPNTIGVYREEVWQKICSSAIDRHARHAGPQRREILVQQLRPGEVQEGKAARALNERESLP
jgi:carbon storage regulator CsrA